MNSWPFLPCQLDVYSWLWLHVAMDTGRAATRLDLECLLELKATKWLGSPDVTAHVALYWWTRGRTPCDSPTVDIWPKRIHLAFRENNFVTVVCCSVFCFFSIRVLAWTFEGDLRKSENKCHFVFKTRGRHFTFEKHKLCISNHCWPCGQHHGSVMPDHAKQSTEC